MFDFQMYSFQNFTGMRTHQELIPSLFTIVLPFYKMRTYFLAHHPSCKNLCDTKQKRHSERLVIPVEKINASNN